MVRAEHRDLDLVGGQRREPGRGGAAEAARVEAVAFDQLELAAAVAGAHQDPGEGLAGLARPFAKDDREARDLSWTLLCAAFGYALVFWTLEMGEDPAFDHERLAGVLGEALSARASLKATEKGV